MESMNKSSVSRETPMNSSSSSSVHSCTQEFESMRERGIITGESLSLGLERIYKTDIFKYDNVTKFELQILLKYRDILELITEQKLFHFNGLIRTFEIARRPLEQVRDILVRRDLLQSIEWSGRAKSTFGMVLYLTNDCSRKDMDSYLRDSITQDTLRFTKELQRDKKKKSPKQVMDHNTEVRKLAREKKKDEPLSQQERAKAILTAEQIDIHIKDVKNKMLIINNHRRTCKQCRDMGDNSKCYDYNHMRQSYNNTNREILKAMSIVPDKISDVAIDPNTVETLSTDLSYRLAAIRSNDKASQLEETDIKEIEGDVSL